MLASGANTAFAARVPGAMGPVTGIPVHHRLRVLRRADNFIVGDNHMLDFLTANLGNIIVLAVLLLAVVLIIISMRRDRKNGKSSCGCSCANCPSAGICHKN